MTGFVRVWWHCLWRTFIPGHRMCSIGTTVFDARHFCECGFNTWP